MSDPAAKKQKTLPHYELLYWPGMPGRGEFVRLPLEAAGASYTDVSNEQPAGMKAVGALINPKSTGDDDGNPPAFAPPALKVPGAGLDGKSLVIHQTPNILIYLGPRLGLVADEEPLALHTNQIALTALDLTNEAHDTHHPVAIVKYYEEQKEEALKKAEDFRANRMPKFFSYFERNLKANEPKGQGKYLVGSKLSYADTTVWQALDGLFFAFPKQMDAIKGDYPLLFETFYPNFKEESRIKEYLASKRRQKYKNGIFRHYPELDRE